MQNPASLFLRVGLFGLCLGLITTKNAFGQDPLPTATPLETPPPFESPPPIPPPPLIEVNPCIATVTLASGQAVEVRSTWSNVFPLVEASAGETVNIELGFPVTAAAATLLASPLDGGNLVADTLSIGLDGKVSMQFQVGTLPGLYRLLLNVGGQIMTLQFSVPNPDEASASPTPNP
jgi:hypothetical protein